MSQFLRFAKTDAYEKILWMDIFRWYDSRVFSTKHAPTPLAKYDHPSTQCSPSRAAILTGRQIWQLEEAGTHSSYFPKKFPVFTDALEGAGYFLGFTGKPWGPGNFKDAG